MKEMYFMLALAGWIWLALVAPLMIGVWVVRWRRAAAARAQAAARVAGIEVRLTDGPDGGETTAELESGKDRNQ
jgi:hypothetical protein